MATSRFFKPLAPWNDFDARIAETLKFLAPDPERRAEAERVLTVNVGPLGKTIVFLCTGCSGIRRQVSANDDGTFRAVRLRTAFNDSLASALAWHEKKAADDARKDNRARLVEAAVDVLDPWIPARVGPSPSALYPAQSANGVGVSIISGRDDGRVRLQLRDIPTDVLARVLDEMRVCRVPTVDLEMTPEVFARVLPSILGPAPAEPVREPERLYPDGPERGFYDYGGPTAGGRDVVWEPTRA